MIPPGVRAALNFLTVEAISFVMFFSVIQRQTIAQSTLSARLIRVHRAVHLN